MNELKSKLEKVKLILLDVDGTMTDGGIYVLPDGTQIKRFFAQDGQGIKMAMQAGIEVGIISAAGLAKDIIMQRAQLFGIKYVYAGSDRKIDIAKKWCEELQLLPENIAYMGDDIIDAEVMRWCGASCAPCTSHKSALEVADYITKKEAGHGAVREFIDLFLRLK